MSTALKWDGAAVAAKVHNATVEALTDGAQHLADKSREEVPVSPYAGGGYLRDSLKVAVDEANLTAAVGYDTGKVKHRKGSKGGNLAVLVHERAELQHSTGNAKFLEKPFNAEKDAILRQIAADIKRKTGM